MCTCGILQMSPEPNTSGVLGPLRVKARRIGFVLPFAPIDVEPTTDIDNSLVAGESWTNLFIFCLLGGARD